MDLSAVSLGETLLCRCFDEGAETAVGSLILGPISDDMFVVERVDGELDTASLLGARVAFYPLDGAQ